MSRITIYRPDGSEVVPRSRLQRLGLRVAALLVAAALLAFVATALFVGLLVAIPIVALALGVAARLWWSARFGHGER